MKASILLTLLTTLHVSASLYSQDTKLTLDLKNRPMTEVFKSIEQQSTYRFFYSDNYRELTNLVTINVKDKNINDVLNSLLEEKALDFRVLDNNIVVIAPVKAFQQLKVTGKVTDASTGEALPGVSIRVEGTTIGAVTDMSGQYTLDLTKPDVELSFSFMGYLTETVQVNGQNTINVKLAPDIKTLDEVVVIGYGTAKKSDLTGAVARANKGALENSPNVNLMQSLKGVVPGLNIGVGTTAGDDPVISIRGQNSISGSTTPLIVLDGIIYRGAFTDINPNDIESVDVLKDASSAAIYGSQGANGVILITTKSATKMSKPIIEYSGEYSTQSLINNDIKPLDAAGFVQQLKDLFILPNPNGTINGSSRTGADLLQENPNFDVTTKFKDAIAIQGYLNGTNTDWYHMLSNKHPYLQNHNLSIRGKNEMTSYFLSFGYSDQKNLVINDVYKRYNFRINLDTKITNWLKVGTQSYYNISDFSGSNTGFGNLTSIPAQVTPYNADGSLKQIIYLGGLNPLLQITQPNLDVRNSLSGTFYADISIPWVKGLSYRANYSRYHDSYRNYNFNPYANNNTGTGNKYNAQSDSYTFDNIVTYKKDFGKHSFNATLVYGIEERKYENTNAAAQNFTDMTLGYDELGAGTASLNTVTSDAWKETSLYTMARLVYSFKERYMFTGTIRRDGFSGFTETNKFGVFPSVALGWRLSEENFFKNNISLVDNLKLRLSYGQSGNRTAGRYSSLAQMTPYVSGTTVGGYLYGDGATGQISEAVNTMANNNLKWETTTSTNIGIDLSILKGRLFGNYEFYVSNTKDLLYNVDVPQINGPNTTSIPTNIGKLRNLGHEFSITGVPVKTKDFEWTITGNFSLNKNKVITILGTDVNKDGKEDDLISASPYPIFIGKSLNPVYDFKITGMYQIADYNAGTIPSGFYIGTYKIQDVNNDGKYDPTNDRKILGYRDPWYRFSILNTLRYKGFELRAMINSIQGGHDKYLGQPVGDLIIPDQLQNSPWFKFDYWTPENPGAKYRQLGQYNNVVGSGFSPYVSRSFIRLQELSFGYNFPTKLLGKVKISRAKVFVTGTNLFTITKWDGWDPEAGQGLTYNIKKSTDGANQFNGYPTMKSYTLGLNLEF